MLVISSLLACLLMAHLACARRNRSRMDRMMRPGDLWEAEDLDRWLDLIEPFPLGDNQRSPRA